MFGCFDEGFPGSYPLVNDHIAGWNIPMFSRKYIFHPGPFSIAMLSFGSVHLLFFVGSSPYLGH